MVKARLDTKITKHLLVRFPKPLVMAIRHVELSCLKLVLKHQWTYKD